MIIEILIYALLTVTITSFLTCMTAASWEVTRTDRLERKHEKESKKRMKEYLEQLQKVQ